MLFIPVLRYYAIATKIMSPRYYYQGQGMLFCMAILRIMWSLYYFTYYVEFVLFYVICGVRIVFTIIGI